jgi:hypothetical protein
MGLRSGAADRGIHELVIPREGGIQYAARCDQAQMDFTTDAGVYWIIRFRG